jgi:hypothetical protein
MSATTRRNVTALTEGEFAVGALENGVGRRQLGTKMSARTLRQLVAPVPVTLVARTNVDTPKWRRSGILSNLGRFLR